MPETVLQIDPRDNVLVALVPLAAGTTVRFGQASCPVTEHPRQAQARTRRLQTRRPRFSCTAWWWAKQQRPFRAAALLSTRNIRHRTGGYTAQRHPVSFALPDASPWAGRTLHGLSPRRRPGGHAQLLARPSARLLREPQRRTHERSARRRTRLRQLSQQLSPAGAPTCRNARQPAMDRATRPRASSALIASFPTSTAFASSPIREAAAARARMRRRSAACSPATSITPTSPAPPC